MDGTTLELLLLAGAVGAFGLAQRRQLRAWGDDLVRRSVGAAAAALSAARAGLRASPAVLTPADLLTPDGRATRVGWSILLNALPDLYPHVLIIGPTGAGKTTFARALLAERPGQLAILTPKPDPEDWPGVPIVTIGDDGGFAELTAAFVALDAELKRRLVARKHQRPIGAPLTIVADDWPVLVGECGKPAGDVFKLVARLGRSLCVRLVILSQSTRVKALALEGEGDAVSNFVRVQLERGYRGVLQSEGRELPLDLSEAPRVAAAASLAPRAWFPPELVPVGEDRADLVVPREPVPGGSGVVPPDTRAAEPESEKIRELVRQGWTRNQIAGELGGRRVDALARIRAVLGE